MDNTNTNSRIIVNKKSYSRQSSSRSIIGGELNDGGSTLSITSATTALSIEELDESYARHRLKYKDERVTLNVGGTRFVTFKSTFAIHPSSLLGVMFCERNKHLLQPNLEGEFFFDRSSSLFEYILDLYRNGSAVSWPYMDHQLRARLRAELDFFQLPPNLLLGDEGGDSMGEKLRRISLERARQEVGDTLARIKAHIIDILHRSAESGKDCEIVQFKSQYEAGWRSRDNSDEVEFYSFVSNLRNRELLLYDLINDNLDVTFQEEFSSSHHSYLLNFTFWTRYTRNGDMPQTDQLVNEFRQKITQLSDSIMLYKNQLK